MTTWDDVHAGSVVLGHDGLVYGVAHVERDLPGGPGIVLVRHGQRLQAQPPPGTPITVVQAADVSEEARAFAVLAQAGLGPEVVREIWT